MGDKIKDRKLGSQEEKNMSRLLLKIILLVFGIGAVFYGIRGICICFTGGTIVLPESSGDKTGGFFLLYRNWDVGINRDKREEKE